MLIILCGSGGVPTLKFEEWAPGSASPALFLPVVVAAAADADASDVREIPIFRHIAPQPAI